MKDAAEKTVEKRSRAEDPATLQEWMTFGRDLLREGGIAEVDTDAWLLMESVLHMSRSQYYMKAREPMPAAEAEAYRELLEKRCRHIPLQQLTGEAWFFGRSFFVDDRVLIPRQDTEVLVEEALKFLKPGMRILDLCTGSGCILLTLCAEMPLKGLGSDLSGQALAVAQENRKRLGVEAELCQGDLFENIDGCFDLIVSNPPYIPTAVIDTLDAEVRDHEPLMALDGEEDGLSFYRRIFREAPRFLKPQGRLCVEIGYDQAQACRQLLTDLSYREIRVVKDLAGLDRVVTARRP